MATKLGRRVSRSGVCAIFLIATTNLTAAAQERTDAIAAAGVADKISASWSRVVQIKSPTPGMSLGHWRAWVEEGWLLVERRDEKDEIEWKVVLAKVVGDDPPEIDADEFGALRLNYDQGRHFIREYSGSDAKSQFGCLRCRRQPKTSEKRWPAFAAPPRDRKAPAAFSGSRHWSLYSRVSGSWLTVTAGPPGQGEQKSADFLLRLYYADIDVGAHGGSFGGEFLRQSYGKWFVEDDGELLVANWLPASLLAEELNLHPLLAGQFATKRLGGAAAPLLSGDVWLNAEKPPTWQSLRGRPVLLVLFDLNQPSFIPLVPPLIGFQEAYRQQGLVVIGVHARGEKSDIAKRLASERIAFPVLIDDGKTTERYGIGYSACVLIGSEGKVVSVYKDSLAPPAEIEKLLEEKP